MASIRFENISKSFGRKKVLNDVSFEVKDKEFFCILGPPGAGKTTLFRLLAGVEKPDEGKIYIDGQVVNDVPPRYRDVSMLFETLALFPNKTGFENIAFPLRIRKMPEDEIKEKVLTIARSLKIEHLLDREPRTFSGGERQRVALAKTIIRRPKVFLLDEPLSNIDALLRLNMRIELKRLASELGQTIMYSTHDQAEATSMGQRIAVIDKGVIHQIGIPSELYNHPVDKTVAMFIGSPPMNFVECAYEEEGNKSYLRGPFQVDTTEYARLINENATSKELILGVRPEHIIVSKEPTSRKVAEGIITSFEPIGSKTIVHVKTREDVTITAVGLPWGDYSVGDKVWIDFEPDKFHIIDKKTDKVLA